MKQTLVVANQKGGVGKTTTAINLAASLVRMDKHVLLVDLDPQGNASSGIGVDITQLEASSWDWLMSEAAFEDVVQHPDCGVDVMPSNSDLTAAEVDLLGAEDRTHRLRDRLENVGDYEYTIIDCPPSLNVLTVNALMASTGVLIPMQCEYFALEGLTSLLDTLDKIRSNGNQQLRTEGILRTMYDPRNSLTNMVSRELFEYFGDLVYRTVIPRNVRLAEAPSHGQPVNLYDRLAKGSVAYMALANEVLRRHTVQTQSKVN